MKRKILLTVLALAAVLLATPYLGMAHATPSTPVSGTIEVLGFTPLGAPSPAGKSDNVIVTGLMSVAWVGDIAGDTTYEAYMMVHNFVPPAGGPDTTLNIHERIFFPTVTVLGKSGSLTLQVSANLARGRDEFLWTILSGTGELVNLNGHGTYHIVATPMYAYEGEVHFDPK